MSGAAVPEGVREGEVLAGKYRVEKVLGAGGMGVVVAATHLQLDQRVALKFLLPNATVDPEIVARFSREARAAAKIHSEHVARVIDVGTLPETGSPYMVMEYLDGSDLSQLLHKRGPLPVAEAVGYVLQACEAIAEAHAAGIVHRDLKPANLFLAKRPGRGDVVKVLDFGISKLTTTGRSEEVALTKTAAVMGSPLYMSPEQLLSAKSVDARSDVWALGVILYELIAARPPFDGATVAELVTRILHAPHASLLQARPDVPPALDDAIARCLQKEPNQRFADVTGFAKAIAAHGPTKIADISLERISRLSGEHATVDHERIALARTAPMGSLEVPTNAWGGTNLEVGKRSSTGMIVAAVAVVALLGAGAYFAFGRGAGPTPTTVRATEATTSTIAAAPPPSATSTGTAMPIATETATAIASSSAAPPTITTATNKIAGTAKTAPKNVAKTLVSAPPVAPPVVPPVVSAPPPKKNVLLDMEPK